MAPTKPRPDETLIRGLARAHRWKRLLEEGEQRSALEGQGYVAIGFKYFASFSSFWDYNMKTNRNAGGNTCVSLLFTQAR